MGNIEVMLQVRRRERRGAGGALGKGRLRGRQIGEPGGRGAYGESCYKIIFLRLRSLHRDAGDNVWGRI